MPEPSLDTHIDTDEPLTTWAAFLMEEPMRSVPKSFYNSTAWTVLRDNYLGKHPLCEDCLLKGKYTPAEHVHHLIHLSPENYMNPEISLNEKYLRALCIDCHNTEHAQSKGRRRFKVNQDGTVTPLVGT